MRGPASEHTTPRFGGIRSNGRTPTEKVLAPRGALAQPREARLSPSEGKGCTDRVRNATEPAANLRSLEIRGPSRPFGRQWVWSLPLSGFRTAGTALLGASPYSWSLYWILRTLIPSTSAARLVEPP